MKKPDDWRIQGKVKELLLRANVERMRGNYEKALEILKQAQEIAPNDPQVLELYGDILRARGKVKEALEMYQLALQKEGHRPTVEEKVAILSLEILEMEKQRQFREWLKEHPERRPKTKNPAWAAIASMMIPGAGQVYNGDFAKGVVLFVISLFSFIGWLSPISDAFAQAAKHSLTLIEVMRQWSTFKLLFILVMMMTFASSWTYSIIEATLTAIELKRVAELEYEEAFRRKQLNEDSFGKSPG